MDLNELNALKQNHNGSQINNNLQPTPPPIPLRPNTYNRMYGYSPMQNPMYSSYGASNYFNNYSSYSPYNNSFTSPYSNMTNNPSNSFLRAAEDNSRNAFQSIESVVQAFSAVSAMFESTFHAVYNSFRAVVGVADQFYRLKTHLTNVLSAFAVFRALKYLYRRLKRILRLGKNTGEDQDDLWKLVTGGHDAESLVKDNKRYTNWPLIMFFAVVVGGPWLIWKILSSIESNNKDDNLWMKGKIDHFVAVSEYDFDAENNDELSFRRGQRIIIAPKEYQPKMRGWLLGTVDGNTSGIIPANYVKILGKKAVDQTQAKSTETTNITKPNPPAITNRNPNSQNTLNKTSTSPDLFSMEKIFSETAYD